MGRLYGAQQWGRALYNHAVQTRRMQFLVVVAAVILCSLAGCGSSGAPVSTEPPRDIMGTYYSTEDVGSLGELKLTIEWNTEALRYKGILESTSASGFGKNGGLGTLGGTHLVLNFYDKKDSASFYYYFLEAAVSPAQGDVTELSGKIVFPDQAEELSVTFRPR
jgi:hypothetical protein